MSSIKIDESVFDKLAEVLKKHNLNEIEYKSGETRIRLSASGGYVPVAPNNVIQPQIQQDSSVAPESKDVGFDKHPGAVKSPMVGTSYLAPEPGASNFISVGDSVQKDQPLLIIEAMKVMNLIKAPKAGKIVHIAVENAAPVEFGQLLVVIE